jgi:hypothetical protein
VAVLLSAHDINPLLPVMDKVVYLAERAAPPPGRPSRWCAATCSAGLTAPDQRAAGRRAILVVAGSTVTGPRGGRGLGPILHASSSPDSGAASRSGRPAHGAGRRPRVRRGRRLHRPARPVLRRPLARRPRHARRLRGLPGRHRAAVGVHHRGRRGRRGDGPRPDPSGAAPGTCPPASCSARSSALSALLLYFDTTSGSTTGVTVTVLFGSLFAVTGATSRPRSPSPPSASARSSCSTGRCCSVRRARARRGPRRQGSAARRSCS